MKTKESDKKMQKIYSLTPLQEGILFHHLEDSQSTGYVVQSILKVTGQLNEYAIRKSLDYIERRHAALRTSIIYEGLSKPRQVVFVKKQIELSFLDLSEFETSEQEKLFESAVHKDINRGYNLTTDSLMRVTCVKYDEQNHKIIFNFHHIIIDGWCTSLVFGDLFKYYNWLIEGRSEQDILEQIEREERLGGKYSDYIQWLEKQDQEEGLAYWEELLESYDQIAKIDSMEALPQTQEQMCRLSISLGKEKSQKLIDLAKENQVTINTVAEAAWGVVLQKYNNSNDVVFGKVVSGRNADIEGIEQIVGLLVNTIPVRVKSNDEIRAKDLWYELQKVANEGISYHYCSLAEIQGKTRLGSDLIQTLFVFENYYIDEKSLNAGMKRLSIQMVSGREQTNYDITISMHYNEEGLHADVIYAPNKYGEGEMKKLLEKINQVLIKFGENDKTKIRDIELINEKEQKIVLNEFNDTYTEYPRDKTVVQLFEEQVQKTPDKTAVIYDGAKITYRELNEKSNQVAHILREKGVTRDTFVAILAERNIETIIGIYGIIKAGGAYVPVDPKYPKERLNYILKDSAPKAVLTYKTRIETDIEVIDLSDEELYKNNSVDSPVQLNKPEDLIYVIYTSGTTGKPKGVMIEHRNVLRLVKNTNYVELNQDTKILQTGSIAFDASTFELFGSLLNGGELSLIKSEDLTDGQKLKEILDKNGINTIFITTALFNQMIDLNNSIFDKITNILVGGERASEDHIKRLLDRRTANFIHVYGPTESTTFTSSCEIKCIRNNKIPIGKPISNTKIYILDGINLCGIGITGEICIAGEGLARGYLNEQELTKEKFIDNPFGEGKLYRSGDFGRWLEDGNIEFLGRIDEQVKIRGFRIELGEIESEIKNHPGVKEAAVIVKQDKTGDKGIYAYIVAEQDVEIDSLRDGLAQALPEYMIPSHMMKIDALPLTINGKWDKRALPEIEMKTRNEYIAPRNHQEEIVSQAFKEVLDVEKVGVKDNFFALGGNSIKSIKLVYQLRELQYEIQVKDIINGETVEKISKLMRKVGQNKELIEVAAVYSDYISEDHCENKMEQLDKEFFKREMDKYLEYTKSNIVYSYSPTHLQKVFLVANSTNCMDQKIVVTGICSRNDIIGAVKEIIINSSDSLRTSYDKKNEQLVIYEHDANDNLYIPYFDLTQFDDGYIKEMHQFILEGLPVEYEEGRKNQTSLVVVTKEAEDKHVVYIVVSHAVWDGMSTKIFADEMARLLNFSNDKKPVQQNIYRDYVDGINQSKLDEIDMFKYVDATGSFIDYNIKNPVVGVECCILNLGRNTLKLYQNRPWDFIAYLAKIWAGANKMISKDSSDLPVLLIQEDRPYLNNDYKDNLGVYLDFLPVLINAEKKELDSSAQSDMVKMFKIKEERKVNFFNVLYDILSEESFVDVVYINNLGIFDMVYNDFEKAVKTVEKYIGNVFIRKQIMIGGFSKGLAIYYTLSKYNSGNLKEILQEACDKLETILLDA